MKPNIENSKPPSPLRRAAAMAGTVLSSAMLMGASSSGGGAEGRALTPGETGVVASIVDGDTLFMESGLKVRLSATQAPKLPLGRKGFKAWPLGEVSKKALSDLILGKKVQLFYGGLERDRYDRALAQMFTMDNGGDAALWVQEEMIKMGMARVYTWPDTWQDSARLYQAEREARAEKRGIWGHAFYAVRTPDPNALAQDVDSFQIVEGIITSAAQIRGRTYLNFGADYKTDFTIVIERAHRRAFKTAGLDPLALEGARVRVRGWIELANGPAIWLDHPQRLEVVD